MHVHSRIDDDVGVNYHVPMSTFRLGWERLLAAESWTSSEAKLGVFGLEDPPRPGARLKRVMEGRPAALAGLLGGDVVCGLDGEWVDSPQQLRWYLADLLPGREIELIVEDIPVPEGAR